MKNDLFCHSEENCKYIITNLPLNMFNGLMGLGMRERVMTLKCFIFQ